MFHSRSIIRLKIGLLMLLENLSGGISYQNLISQPVVEIHGIY